MGFPTPPGVEVADDVVDRSGASLWPHDDAPQPELIARMEEIARAEGLSGREFTRRCGLASGYWSRIRRGYDQLGVTTCARIVQAYPELRPAARRYLAARYGTPALKLLGEAADLIAAPEEHPPDLSDPPV